MEKRFNGKFWTALVIFSLIGQVAWVVENMYFNVFIYKMFHASAADISLMVGASSVAATVTTIFMGALTDYLGRRKGFICGGYLAWGISILAFAFLRMDLLTPLAGNALQAASLGITLVIILDCVMTFLGSSANDASFNAWMTDWGDSSNRGKIEGVNSMMPLVAILVVFGGFSVFDLDKAESWTAIYLIVGIAVTLIGVSGFFVIDEKSRLLPEDKAGFRENLFYSFRPSVVRENPLLYAIIGAFAVFGVSINIFMPYLILYYEKTLGMTDYVLIMAPAIVMAAVITAFYGRLFDLLGFKSSVIPAVCLLMAGYILLYTGRSTAVVFIGSLLMMTGYLTGMAVFGAMIRSHIPEGKAGRFQGIRIIGQVLVPGILGPAVGAAVLCDAEQIINSDGTASFLPNRNIYAAAFAVAAGLLILLWLIFRMMRNGHHLLISQSGRELLTSIGLLPKRQETEPQNTDRRNINAENSTQTEEIWAGYPRPRMRRTSFRSLNGKWTLNGKEILIPFPPQSLLSGYQGPIGRHLEYVRKFILPPAEKGRRLILHFGAVDQIAEVYLNGLYLGKHEGGYLPFSFDITNAMQEGENQLLVKATDALSPRYPYGKQRKARGGMWYTPVSGIWQNVWLEYVPEVYITGLDITADTEKVHIHVRSSADTAVSSHDNADIPHIGEPLRQSASATLQQKAGPTTDAQSKGITGQEAFSQQDPPPKPGGISVTVKLHNGSLYSVRTQNQELEINLSQLQLADGSTYQPVLWSPEHPCLYDITVTMGEDIVSSYFGLRTVETRMLNGIPRICLNGEPIFLHGVLDQGYFCDGIYLPAREEEYQRDILRMKELGFNLLRKHIKIEPECFYYYCDVHGMLVMQDMVNSGLYSWIKDTALPTIGIFQKGNGRLWGRKKRRDFFVRHMEETIRHLQSHPSVIAYTLFNEGWGQFDGDAIYDRARALDPTRLYDTASGWFPVSKSDFDSQHIYFRKLMIPEKPERPVLISECGGYSYRIPNHYYAKYNQFGYGECADSQELTARIRALYGEMVMDNISKGVCGCIYTQLSDVEDETNGLYTYDRKVCKAEPVQMKETGRHLEDRMRACYENIMEK
ncbi:MFS transporter [Acetatifactor muris]|uniref:MFS transporter n=1 Tax=Acetatifactor muris TaxID=879566 RepID=UPI0023F41578|nr:MFS transporter [Acetatifactor muris]